MIQKTFITQLRSRVSLSWLALMCIAIVCIWGNSLVPGEGSGGMSLAVVEAIRRVLSSLGLPFDWVTNFIVRKTGHFMEYLLLGVVSFQAFRAYDVSRGALVAVVLTCVMTASIDETIQLLVPGRCGQIADVLLDCCGAVSGIVLRFASIHVHVRKETR